MLIEITYNVTDVFMSTTVSPVYVNVSFEAPAGGGGTEWGDITGTLSDQTDLQTALDAKFDDPTGTSLQYIDGTGALQTFPLTLPVLQEVRNQTGATLDAGTVVYINGATGNKPTVTKAIATGDATSAQTLGMVSAAIANNGTGYVVVIGTCSGLDTSAFTEGQQLYLSYTTAGAVTTTKPYAPYHLVYIGIVTRAHPTLGTVEVRVQNGYELDEIHDVDALNPNNNDGLFYNTSTSLWEHKQISTALGYTPANAATTLTINGVSYDLSTSRTWSVGSVTGTGASGQVAYWTGTSAQSGSNNLFWDATNSRLGIGTNAPAEKLHVAGNATYRGLYPYFELVPSGWSGGMFYLQAGVNDNGSTAGNYTVFFNSQTTRGFSWVQNSSPRMALTPSNNLIIQNGGTFTDSGERLQVTGTMKVTGASSFGGVVSTNSTSSYFSASIQDARDNFFGGGNTFLTSGYTYVFWSNRRFQPTSGNSTFTCFYIDSIINQTGGANGITRGLYVAPTLTAAADWRSIEWSNNSGWGLYGAGTANNYLGGNLLLGSTTSSGERLQVTGTMKVTDNVTLSANASGLKGYSASNTNSGGIATFTVSNDLGTDGFFRAYGSTFGTSTYSELSDIIGFGSRKSIKIFTDSQGGSGGTNSIQFMAGGYNNDQERARIGTYGMLIGTKTSVASAILTIESTTKGFLPPRMTTTQKNAISSPAAGLVVYDTTLAKLCVYTTAWETITSV